MIFVLTYGLKIDVTPTLICNQEYLSMPQTKKFQARTIGFTIENEKILDLWSVTQQNYLPKGIPAIYTYDKTNAAPQSGPLNTINRALSGFWDIGERGQQITISSFEVRLTSSWIIQRY